MATKKQPRKVSSAGQKPKAEVVEAPTDKRIQTTMEELGAKLPVGILHEGREVRRDLVVKTWKTKDERELGKKIAPDAGMAEHVALVVSNMCSRIGPHDLDSMSDAEKETAISMMYMADVFYAYTYLRFKAVSRKLHLNVTCPRSGCGEQFPWAGDLGSTEVHAVDEIDHMIWSYDLQDPIEVRGNLIESFKMAYPKWTVMVEERGNTNEADLKAAMIRSSVIGLGNDDTPTALLMSEIDELSKRDFEGLQDAINNNFLGPKMAVEGTCSPDVCKKYKRGGHDFLMPIDWSYKSFFGSSSLSPTPTT